MAVPSSSDVLEEQVHAAFRAWHKPGGEAGDLLEELLLVRRRRAELAGNGSARGVRQATNQVLLEAIEELEGHDSRGATVLRQRFCEGQTLYMVANALNVSDHTVSRAQRAAIESVTHILVQQEQAEREERVQRIEALLPPPSYTRLFGVSAAREVLYAQLQAGQTPWVVALSGLGGIGKTALADAVTRLLVRDLHYEDVIWLRIEPPTMSGRSVGAQLTYEGLLSDLA